LFENYLLCRKSEINDLAITFIGKQTAIFSCHAAKVRIQVRQWSSKFKIAPNMADQDWKTRVGVEINISSSSEDDDNVDGKGYVCYNAIAWLLSIYVTVCKHYYIISLQIYRIC